jgi:hypothetical protein
MGKAFTVRTPDTVTALLQALLNVTVKPPVLAAVGVPLMVRVSPFNEADIPLGKPVDPVTAIKLLAR